MTTHERYMRLALRLAQQAAQQGEVPVGAVLVCGDKIIAQDHNRTETFHDPTAHAEILCLTAATHALQSKYLLGCTLYVTLEPCAMCAGALGWAQLGMLVYGASDPQKGYTRYVPSPLHPKTQVLQGVLAEEARALLQDFFRRRR